MSANPKGYAVCNDEGRRRTGAAKAGQRTRRIGVRRSGRAPVSFHIAAADASRTAALRLNFGQSLAGNFPLAELRMTQGELALFARKNLPRHTFVRRFPTPRQCEQIVFAVEPARFGGQYNRMPRQDMRALMRIGLARIYAGKAEEWLNGHGMLAISDPPKVILHG